MAPPDPSADSERAQRKQRVKRARIAVKYFLLILTVVLVVKFQINRPKVIHSYQTSDPLKNTHGGKLYTCGCSLPPQVQGPNVPANEANVNRCYDSSEVQNVDILMYSNFSGAKTVHQILKRSYKDSQDFKEQWRPTTVKGYRIAQQGRYISWNNDSLLENFRNLSLNSPDERKRVITTDYIQNGEFLDFPGSFVAVAFVFECSDCSSCSLASVNKIFESLQKSNQSWGDCKHWGNGDSCHKQNSYEAKCVMYPTAMIPLNFALRTVLRELLKFPGIKNIAPPQDPSSVGKMSFDGNMLYMNFRKVSANQAIRLNFFELSRRSSAWSELQALFPTLDKECKTLEDVNACGGNSMCNMFKSAEDAEYTAWCSDLKSQSKCRDDLLITDKSGEVKVDDSDNLWGEYGVTKNDWSALMCRNYSCKTAPPYTVLWETAVAMKDDAFNYVLTSKIHAEELKHNSGVCTKTYRNVVRQAIKGRTTYYMLANCSQDSGNGKAAGFCWLTGQYYRLNDKPKDRPQNLNVSAADPLFVCYYVGDQNRLLWLVISFGVLFGWLGSIDLLVNWILLPCSLCALQSFRDVKKRVKNRINPQVNVTSAKSVIT